MTESGESNVLNTIKLEDFVFKSILINNAAKKLICLLGSFTNSTEAGIIIIEKVEFTETSIVTQNVAESILKHIKLNSAVINDVYGNYLGETDASFNRKFLFIILILKLNEQF